MVFFFSFSVLSLWQIAALSLLCTVSHRAFLWVLHSEALTQLTLPELAWEFPSRVWIFA